MKHLPLFICALATIGTLASCTGDLYRRTVPATTTATSGRVAPPAFGSPAYVSSLRPQGPPSPTSTFYPYSASHPGGMGYYDRVTSPYGSYQYIYHDLEAPHPPPGTRLKEKTVRYTSHYPSTWGAPVWVTSFKPVGPARPTDALATTTTVEVTQTRTRLPASPY